MGKLIEKSSLYQNLSEQYDNNIKINKDITYELFDKCIDIAKRSTKREIRFVLFELKNLYEENETGNETATAILKLITHMFGNNRKASFMISVLETALDEK